MYVCRSIIHLVAALCSEHLCASICAEQYFQCSSTLQCTRILLWQLWIMYSSCGNDVMLCSAC